jgi:adenosylmethionine-8-amino-7-oxononanoate aminotransferase
LVLTHGEGTKLYDAHGKEYLDFAAGIAVNALGKAPVPPLSCQEHQSRCRQQWSMVRRATVGEFHNCGSWRLHHLSQYQLATQGLTTAPSNVPSSVWPPVHPSVSPSVAPPCISPSCAGHGDPRWLQAVVEQAAALSHTSNLFHTVPQVLVAS